MDYEGAICALNTLQHDASVIAQIQRNQIDPEFKAQCMLRNLQQTGLTVEELDKLNIIHVAGTKGKGSTCAFTERILRNYGFRTGFFSSPHLVHITERIRINGQPISKELFAKYFWEVYEQLVVAKDVRGGTLPDAFQIFTLMAFHVFLQEGVDLAIIEVGIGGVHDYTNIIRKPWVCGISSLGIDHTVSLGDTIEKIAWHKAGIFKPGVPAFTVSQPPIPLGILQDRAEEIGCSLLVCPDLQEYEAAVGPLSLGLTGQVQHLNASLALQLSHSWIQSKEAEGEGGGWRERGLLSAPVDHRPPQAAAFQLSSNMLTGLRDTQWLGRNQTVRRGVVTYYLDGAHTMESMQACVEWFTQKALREDQDPGLRVLLFNVTGERDYGAFLKLLGPCGFDYAVFCPNVPESAPVKERFCGSAVPVPPEICLDRCLANQSVWETLAGTPTQVCSCITSALQWISQGTALASGDPQQYYIHPSDGTKALREAAHISVLVTGSLHLVGGVLELLDFTP